MWRVFNGTVLAYALALWIWRPTPLALLSPVVLALVLMGNGIRTCRAGRNVRLTLAVAFFLFCLFVAGGLVWLRLRMTF